MTHAARCCMFHLLHNAAYGDIRHNATWPQMFYSETFFIQLYATFGKPIASNKTYVSEYDVSWRRWGQKTKMTTTMADNEIMF
jgi:hypothetical protein